MRSLPVEELQPGMILARSIINDEMMVILSEGTTLTAKDIQMEQPKAGAPAAGTLKAISDAEEERLVREAVERSNGNISAAAKMLGISRPTLYAKMKKYGL